ncbi:ABC transporter permease [Micromonospora sp. DT47]|uniref:ABC transporter permease n=1 Tax=Micromonospora sp. DT47 TaxID=3393431 RepID=UPI003CF78294
MTTTIEPTDLDLLVDPWAHAEPITPPPAPDPAGDGLRPAVRTMLAELDAHFGGEDPGSIDKAATAMKAVSKTPESWGSRGQVADAVKAYRAKHGIEAKPAAKKEPARTAPPKQSRTAAVRPTPTPPVPPVVQADPPTVVRQPVPPPPTVVQPQPVPQPEPVVRTAPRKPVVVWPVVILAQPAFIAVWSGWVGLGGLTGFGVVHPLPGIADWISLNTAITLPIGVETYGAYALYVALSGRVPTRARRFATWSAIGSLVIGALGQVAYHQLVAAGVSAAPWWITTAVSVLPVAVLGMGAALAHLVREDA